jgi:hypothetical protein
LLFGLKAAIYAPVSTIAHGQDPAVQTREIREYCQRRGWEVAGEYVDAGISGAKDSRPELSRLVADAHLRRFDAVIVWKFDRFARSVAHLLRALQTFRSLGIEFVSLSEQMDTSTPTGKMVFTALGAVAELERSLGSASKRFAGLPPGIPRTRLGPPEDWKLAAECQARLPVFRSWASISALTGQLEWIPAMWIAIFRH